VFHFLRSDQTATDMADEPVSQRPTIALALGGGAARGFAHIGVVRTLVAKGFKPDIIAGTSIGAVVGGCYAAGKLDEIERWARSLTRRRLFSYLDVSLGGLGLISGTRLFETLSEALGDTRIEALPLRFAAIATEIGTGHEIWLTRGRIADALRASYALPGIFPAVQIADRWLMDGALVNPVPVSAARALGARIVIAVNVRPRYHDPGSRRRKRAGDRGGSREPRPARAFRCGKERAPAFLRHEKPARPLQCDD
jgi:NTE family protein